MSPIELSWTAKKELQSTLQQKIRKRKPILLDFDFNDAFFPICFALMFVMVLAKQNRRSLGFKLLQTIFGGVSQIIQHLFINTNCILRAYKSYDVVQCAQETP